MAKYIDAEAFFKLINTTLPYRELDYPDKAVYNAAISDMCDMLIHFPAADVEEVRHGKWETIDKGHFFYDWECSKCGGSGRADYLFCPNCGSRMDLEGDEE